MEIVNLMARVLDRALTRDFKFFCDACKKEIKISGFDIDDGYYENDEDGDENSGTGYFPEGNVWIDLSDGGISGSLFLSSH
jgi:hypothetical protein